MGQAAWSTLRFESFHRRLAHTTQPKPHVEPGSHFRSCSQVTLRLLLPLCRTVPYVFVHLSPKALKRHCAQSASNSLWQAGHELATIWQMPRDGSAPPLALFFGRSSSLPKSARRRSMPSVMAAIGVAATGVPWDKPHKIEPMLIATSSLIQGSHPLRGRF